jgi:hypothetical protein
MEPVPVTSVAEVTVMLSIQLKYLKYRGMGVAHKAPSGMSSTGRADRGSSSLKSSSKPLMYPYRPVLDPEPARIPT